MDYTQPADDKDVLNTGERKEVDKQTELSTGECIRITEEYRKHLPDPPDYVKNAMTLEEFIKKHPL